jgi:uncharacterized protein YbjT (DUF2867 family)
MARESVLVAGGSGHLGRHVVAEITKLGHSVRILTRNASRVSRISGNERVSVVQGDALDPATLAHALDGVSVVFSSVGASAHPSLRGWSSYSAMDIPANANLIEAARAAGAKRFVYISVACANHLAGLDYVDAHERVVSILKASGLAHTVLRPTGFFTAFTSYVDMARRGRAVLIGDGSARSNPIDDRDLALACANVISDGPDSIELGGPETLSRRETVELAYAAVERAPKLTRVPAGVMRAIGALARPFHPRMSHLIAFLVSVMENDMVAPPYGSRTLAAFYRELAAQTK